ncbi:MAG TPA: hypothetical protein VN327_08555 [Pseudonocardiaceae bacterium]|nr:hypothetical protein [Pseudonocardiaceae bacterium]
MIGSRVAKLSLMPLALPWIEATVFWISRTVPARAPTVLLTVSAVAMMSLTWPLMPPLDAGGVGVDVAHALRDLPDLPFQRCRCLQDLLGEGGGGVQGLDLRGVVLHGEQVLIGGGDVPGP